ncbi:MAG: chemotaxis protein CheA [Gammaproteobacteria bacterium]|nr:chemotaxis protein CheA [Gammaproteobacteria bacterium]
MAIDLNDEILQDFLVEASEIVEKLGEQLVELEQRPNDKDLLNSVFRGFHTVKGGAGFLNLTSLVAVCHRAEDVFNLLRQGERNVDSYLMDVILRVVDVVNGMMDSIKSGVDPEDADPSLLQALEDLKAPGAAAPAPVVEVEMVAAPVVAMPASVASEAPASDEITDDEFESLLDQLQGKPGAGNPATVPASTAVVPASDEISEDEFEALLDKLHSNSGATAPVAAKPTPAPAPKAAASDEITDSEFDALLDELSANRKAGAATPPAAVPVEAKPAPAPAASAPKPAAVAAAPKPAVEDKSASETDEHDKSKAAAASKEAAVETTVRVDTKRLDDIMNLVGELVLVRNRMSTLRSTMADEEVTKAIANLDLVTSDLQTAVMKTRMQPIKKVFGRFPRVVRDLARSLKKEVNLELHGEETDLDKNLVEALADPLVHLVRNAVDHGVESPDERVAAGKPRAGTVVLSAEQEGDHILLTIEDDGKGMDPEVLRRKAVEKGMMDEDAAARLDDRACFNLIFAPGFSTKTEISDVSGRGVGMDVVKTRIAQLNGAVEIDSLKGRGSRIVIKLPLTLAIMPTLMVVLGKQIFAFPLANVNEIFDRESARISTVDSKDVVVIRDRAVPLVHLGRWLVNDPSYDSRSVQGYVVITTVGTQQIGFIVDNLVGQEEVVIKPLGALLHGTKGVSGATITGNGGIALILDMPGLMEAYAHTI